MADPSPWTPFADRLPASGQVIEYRTRDSGEPRRGLWDNWRSAIHTMTPDRHPRGLRDPQLHYTAPQDWRPAPPGPFVQGPDGIPLDLGSSLGRTVALHHIAEKIGLSPLWGVSIELIHAIAGPGLRGVNVYADEERSIWSRIEDSNCSHPDDPDEPGPFLAPELASLNTRLADPLLAPLVVQALWRGLMPPPFPRPPGRYVAPDGVAGELLPLDALAGTQMFVPAGANPTAILGPGTSSERFLGPDEAAKLKAVDP